MPFRSRQQQKWAYANDPKLAKKLGKGTNYDKLPDKKEHANPIAMERLPGGEGSQYDPGQFDQVQLMQGMHHELEHTSDVAAAMEIAMDHLVDDPQYYDHQEESRMPKLESIYRFSEGFYSSVDPRHDRDDVPDSNNGALGEVEVSQTQAHLIDDDDLDPLGTGINHSKRPLKFGGSSMRVSNVGV